jgi:hypothetical protein
MRAPSKATALLAGLLCACGGREPVVKTLEPSSAASARPTASGATALEAPALEREPTLLITDPATLTALDQQGLSLGAVLGHEQARNNDELSRVPSFEPLVRELERELREAAAADKLAGVDVARHAHRLFDTRFLRRKEASFVLAGVVNRPDRAPFVEGSCGETRLVYRLSYRLDGERSSKLPMTIGVELGVPRSEGGCRKPAARWLEPPSQSPEARAAWLRSSGPVAPELLEASLRVVVNLQLVRWPSTMRPDLGGHAEYLLRSFRFDQAGALRPEPLENTLAPEAIVDPAGRAELVSWLGQQAAAIDAGTALLPERFLAARALSVTPRGLNRLANRPFSSALEKARPSSLDFTRGAFVKSTAGLLRRLDQLSCQGCHEAQSVAGFHLLGEDADDAPRENALAVPVSRHVTADLPRRLRVARSMLRGEEADFSAPLAERTANDGGYGAHCGLTSDPSFAAWTCDDGLLCSRSESLTSDLVGHCLPAEREVGDACEVGGVLPHANPRRDRLQSARVETCPDMVCNRSSVGFPGGMCTATCGAPGSSCGAIAILDSFNACLARGESFLTCIRGNAAPAGLRACDAVSPCRDDYVCARGKQGGVCIPPYFVFQLRVDGHNSGLR